MEESKRVPKPRRVECRFIANESAREVTFSKRHQGLFRKAAELSVLCGAEVAIITYSPHGNPFAFAHPSTPDTLIDRYLSGGTNGHTAVEAATHRKQYEESVRKLQEVKRETERIKANAGRNRWWDEIVGDDVGEEELEHYVASLERLEKLVVDQIGQSADSDSDFYSQLIATDMSINSATDMSINSDLDTEFVAEVRDSC